MELSNQECERARFRASLALDGELSELERAALDAHLRSCDLCREYAAGVASVTASLRSAPLVDTAPVVVREPRSRLRVRPPLVAAAAVLVAIAVGAGTLVGTLSSRGTTRGPQRTASAQRPFIEQQVLALANGVAAPKRGRGSGRVIAS